LNETVVQGLYISVVGMGLVFASLGLLLLVMVGLVRLFPAKVQEGTAPEARPESEEKDDLVLAAIIGLALAEAAEAGEPVPLEAEAVAGAWTVAGRNRQLRPWRRGGRTSYWIPGR